jgi:hypothetical protein
MREHSLPTFVHSSGPAVFNPTGEHVVGSESHSRPKPLGSQRERPVQNLGTGSLVCKETNVSSRGRLRIKSTNIMEKKQLIPDYLGSHPSHKGAPVKETSSVRLFQTRWAASPFRVNLTNLRHPIKLEYSDPPLPVLDKKYK